MKMGKLHALKLEYGNLNLNFKTGGQMCRWRVAVV